MDLPWESAAAPSPASSPPPPPPPAPRGAAPPAVDQVELRVRLDVLAERLDAVERELLEQRVFRRRLEQQPLSAPVAAAPASGDEAVALRREVARLRQELDAARAAPPPAPPPPPAGAAGPEVRAELEALRTRAADGDRLRQELDAAKEAHKRLVQQYERIEGEYQSLKLLHEEQAKKVPSDASSIDLTQPDAREKVAALASERQRLADELAGLKRDAASKVKQLKTQLDKTKSEYDTVRLQKDNLLKELMTRDDSGAEAIEKRQLTLEEITASEVFKTMLGNIRRTSREEVTHLHDAVVQLKAINPEAYNQVLDVVARKFKDAAMENPLALLPRA